MDFGKLMAQANRMQRDMKKKQEEVDKTLFTAETSGGAIKASMYGNYHLEKVEIDKDAIDPKDKEMLEDMVVTGINAVIEKVQNANEKISQDMQAQAGMGGFPGM